MKLIVSRTSIQKQGRIELTTGMIGQTVDVEFAPDWNGYAKVAVFRNFIDGETPIIKENPTSPLTIPSEVLQIPDARCYVGFYGYNIVDGVKTQATPTIYTALDVVKLGATYEGNPAMDIEATVAEQLIADVSTINGRLDTDEAEITDLDERVTELEEHGGGGGTSDYTDLENKPSINGVELSGNKTTEQLGIDIPSLAGYATEQWVEAKGYLTEHQSLAAYRTSAAQDDIDDAQDTAIAAKYTKPSGGIPKTDLASGVQASLDKADTALQSHQDISGKSDVVISLDTNITPTQVATAISQGKTVVITTSHGTFGSLSFEAWNVATNLHLVISNTTASVLGSWATISLQGNLSTDSWALVSNFIATSQDVTSKLDVAQGVSHAGEFLVVGDDGNVTTQSLPLYDGSVI